MNPLGIVAEYLQSIPPQVRRWLLLAYVLVVLVVYALRVFGVDMNYDAIETVLLVIGGYLGIQSAANVNVEKGADDGTPTQ